MKRWISSGGTSYEMNFLYFNPLVFPLTRLILALQPRWLRSSQLCLSPEPWAILQHSCRCYIFSHFHGYKLPRFHRAASIHPLPPSSPSSAGPPCWPAAVRSVSLAPSAPNTPPSQRWLPTEGNQKRVVIPQGVRELNHTAGWRQTEKTFEQPFLGSFMPHTSST